MTNAEEGLRDRLGAIREAYLLKLADKMKEVEEKWNSVGQSTRWPEGIVELHRLIHTLAGSSAVFGMKSLSAAARDLERLLKSTIEEEELCLDTIREKVSEHIEELNRFSSVGVDHAMPRPDITLRRVVQTPMLPEEREKKLIYLIEDDPIQLENLAVQITHFGYTVRPFSTLDSAAKAVKELKPSAIIMDIIFPEGDLAGIETIIEIRKEHVGIPVVFISRRNDLDARLRAVKAGGDAYFMKPINMIEIVEKLDTLTMPKEFVPYRILIVDDDPDLSAYYLSILQDAGMTTLTVNDPLHVMDTLIEFNPDLILMDMYMPGCSGQELASVIRQMPAYVSIPIVFLSTETDVDRRLTAMRVGGDDFLTKPIEPHHLISSITIRAERMRIMRSFMERDGLTGLLNHTNIVGQLELAVNKAVRQKNGFSFAMIDIDRFKSVNDTYGHSMGDRVLNSLARLLQQRLRKTDIVGRYGGEEFAVVLQDTGLEAAKDVLDEIRESFSKIEHVCGEKTFTVTFSGGLAAFPDFDDPVSLTNAADAALYRSKNEGRNCVTVMYEQTAEGQSRS